MVVKVVSEKPIKTKKLVCSKCGYELEYTGEDIHSFTSRDYTGDSDEYYTITCPRQSCGQKNYVDSWNSH